jgi:hypothetical protein
MGAPFVLRTHFEICRYSGGKLVGQPLPVATLREAQEESAYMARGNLIDERGNREPSMPVFELDDGEEPGQDDPEGLYIKRIVTKIEATAVF